LAEVNNPEVGQRHRSADRGQARVKTRRARKRDWEKQELITNRRTENTGINTQGINGEDGRQLVGVGRQSQKQVKQIRV
jgi:hypothetical protein